MRTFKEQLENAEELFKHRTLLYPSTRNTHQIKAIDLWILERQYGTTLVNRRGKKLVCREITKCINSWHKDTYDFFRKKPLKSPNGTKNVHSKT